MGAGRVSVARMLAQARALGEVRIALERGVSELAGLEIALAKALDAREAIVTPLSSPEADPTAPIAAALGTFVSDLIADEMRIGLGWGRTLRASWGLRIWLRLPYRHNNTESPLTSAVLDRPGRSCGARTGPR